MTLSHHIQSVALGLSVLAAFALPAAIAQPADGTSGPARQNAPQAHAWGQKKHRGCGIMKQLNLTEAQRERLKALRESHRGDFESAKAGMKARHEEMKRLRQDPEANKEKLATLRAEMKKDMQARATQRKAELQKVLTPEQFSQFESLRQQCKAQHGNGKRHGKRGGQKPQAPAEGGNAPR